ncbi:ABC transporter ATP-binding protein/permease [Methylomagnum sp.]
MRNIKPFLSDFWGLAKPYWWGSDRRAGLILLAAIVAISLLLVYLSVRLNTWNGDFFNALQNKDQPAFWRLLGEWCVIVLIYVVFGLGQLYLQLWLRIRWREWLTARFIERWLSHRAYYRIQLLDTATDNPDQRIAEDLREFVDITLTLSLGFLNQLVTLGSFIAILWELSGSAVVGGVEIPGYMVWVALLYAIVGTGLTHVIGRRLIGLTFEQQRCEADFRFGLVRFRENTEAVALYQGEADERRGFLSAFGQVVKNWRRLMTVRKNVYAMTTFYSLAANVFPMLVAAPRYFSGAIQLGGLMQISGAFGQVQGALSFFVDSYTQLAEWRAVVDRLTSFEQAMDEAERAALESPGIVSVVTTGMEMNAENLQLALPTGRVLAEAVNLGVQPGERVLVSGPSGSGKSTLFRALAGVWPFGAGRVETPAGARTLFLPQRPYLPIGTVADVLRYPDRGNGADEAALAEVLAEVGLAHLVPALDESAHWAQRLSGGEQQRIAIARALVIKPDWLFLDEATSAIDEAGEAKLYALLAERLADTAIVSIGHRASLRRFHGRELRFERGAVGEVGGVFEEAVAVA